jgi:hypothetical protein
MDQQRYIDLAERLERTAKELRAEAAKANGVFTESHGNWLKVRRVERQREAERQRSGEGEAVCAPSWAAE